MIDPNPPALSIRWYPDLEAVDRAMWEPVAIEQGMTWEEMVDQCDVICQDEQGNEVVLSRDEQLAAMRAQGCWGFLDSNTNTIHAWAAPDADRASVLHMLAHEVGHATGTPLQDGLQEELRAEQFGRVAALAYSLMPWGH